MDDLIVNLLSVILEKLVVNTDAIKIDKDDSSRDGLIIYRVTVDENDMGKVIGRQGRTAKSIRSVVRAAAMLNNIRAAVEIG